MTNIAELLKDAPKGMRLYSPLFGEVRLVCVTVDGNILVETESHDNRYFAYNGVFRMDGTYPNAECLLFPSNKVRTWVGWTPPVKPMFKPKQWVLVRDCDNQTWGLSRFSHRDMGCYVCINREDFRQCIPFEGNEKLLGTTKLPPFNNRM